MCGPRHSLIGRATLPAFGLMFILACEAMQAQSPFHRGAPLASTASVQLYAAAGSVVVEGWERDSIDIRGTIGRGLTPHAGGDRLAFKMSTYDGRQDLSQPSHLVVRVPHRVQLWLKSTTGTIRARALSGAVDLYSISGSITADDMSGDVTTESMRGAVAVSGTPRWLRLRSGEGAVSFEGRARDVAMSTVRGDITLRGAADRARAETVSGRVEISLPARGTTSLDVDSHDGPVRLQLVGSLDATINVFTLDGSITNELTKARFTRAGAKGSVLSVVTGKGSARVTVRTFSGEIALIPR